MPHPTVYLETTVIGHLVGRLHPDPLIAERQSATREWWAKQANRFQLFVSELVADECADGDPKAAAERLAVLKTFAFLDGSQEADNLTDVLLDDFAVPKSEPQDAAHISLAAVNGIQYLLTWNFKHIANPAMRTKIESVCRSAGYQPPIICTPTDLKE